jgi:hypothetical protein
MKKTLLSAIIIATSIGAFAQQKITKSLTASSTINLPADAFLAKTATSSTLTPASVQTGGCATSTTSTGGVVYYSTAQYTATPTYTQDARGYAFGSDATYYTTGGTTYTVTTDMSAQKYNVTGTGVSVTDVLILAGKAKSNGTTSMVNAMIFSENTTSKTPNAQIGVTATKALNTFTTGFSSPNVLTFSTPVPVSAGNFFAAVHSPIIGGVNNDTLAILSTKFGCSSTDSLSWTYTVYNPAALAPSWSSVNANFGSNLDIMIFPVINIAAGLNSITKGDLTLLAAYPNPADNEISINFGLNQSSKVEIEIYDLTGKIVNTLKLDKLESGNHTSKINTSILNAGVYMYSVKSENAKMFSKFTITK